MLSGERVVLRPLEQADAAALRRIREAPEVAAWWGPAEDDFPFGDDPGATRFTILVDGRVAGLIQYGEEPDPNYRHAWIDLFVAADLHGQGLGADAVTTLFAHLVRERCHHRVTIDPAVANTAAVRCYEKAGFRAVGVMRAAERDPLGGVWRDALLMERIELRPGG